MEKLNLILPIGSVVKIRKVSRPVMIFGYFQTSDLRPGEIADYVAVPYPIGNRDISQQMGFPMTAIEEVLFEGYRTEEFKPIENLLKVRLAIYAAKAEDGD